MQDEDTKVQAQQGRVLQDLGQFAARHVFVLERLGRHTPDHHRHAADRQGGRERKQARQAHSSGQHRGQHQGQRKHQRDAAPHQRHGLGAHLVARLVGQQGCDRCRHGSRTLDGSANEQPSQAARQRCDDTARRKQEQAQHNHALASKAIRRHTERNLQQALRQTINAHGQTDQRWVVTAGVLRRFQREYGQDQKQAQHAQGEDGGQGYAGAPFQRRHGTR